MFNWILKLFCKQKESKKEPFVASPNVEMLIKHGGKIISEPSCYQDIPEGKRLVTVVHKCHDMEEVAYVFDEQAFFNVVYLSEYQLTFVLIDAREAYELSGEPYDKSDHH